MVWAQEKASIEMHRTADDADVTAMAALQVQVAHSREMATEAGMNCQSEGTRALLRFVVREAQSPASVVGACCAAVSGASLATGNAWMHARQVWQAHPSQGSF